MTDDTLIAEAERAVVLAYDDCVPRQFVPHLQGLLKRLIARDKAADTIIRAAAYLVDIVEDDEAKAAADVIEARLQLNEVADKFGWKSVEFHHALLTFRDTADALDAIRSKNDGR